MKIRVLLFSILFFGLIVAFQNCSKINPLGKFLTGKIPISRSGGTCVSGSPTCSTNSADEIIPSINYLIIPQNLVGYTGIGSNAILAVDYAGGKIYTTSEKGISISSDNGSTFVTRTAVDGLGSNRVMDIQVSTLGSITAVYAGTSNGLSISTDGGVTFVTKRKSAGLISNFVNGVYASQNVVMAATDSGVSISTDGGNSFFSRTTSSGLGSNSANDVVFAMGKYFVATASGLSISSDGGLTFRNYARPDLPADFIRRLYLDGNRLYVATNLGIAYFDITQSVPSFNAITITNTPTLPSNEIFDIYASGPKVCVGTFSGFAVSNNGGMTFTTFGAPNPFPSSIILGVRGQGNTIVAGTLDGLVVSLDGGGNYSTFRNQWETSGNKVLRISNGTIFSSSDQGLLISTNGGLSFQVKTGADGLGAGATQINDIFVSGTDVYVASDSGIYKSTNSGGAFSQLQAIGISNALSYVITKMGGQLLVGTELGLAFSNDDGGNFNLKLPGLVVYSIFPDQISGRLWVGTDSGLHYSDDGGLNFTQSISSRLIYDIAVDSNRVGVATDQGLYFSQNNGVTYTQFRKPQGIADDLIFTIVLTGTSIYLGTYYGLSMSPDLGATWSTDTQANGLLIDAVFDLVISEDYLFVNTDAGINRSRKLVQ